ncbi:MAG: hypothetical protein ACR2PT_08815, partial [Endozoicomonas sp.]
PCGTQAYKQILEPEDFEAHRPIIRILSKPGADPIDIPALVADLNAQHVSKEAAKKKVPEEKEDEEDSEKPKHDWNAMD